MDNVKYLAWTLIVYLQRINCNVQAIIHIISAQNAFSNRVDIYAEIKNLYPAENHNDINDALYNIGNG